MEQYCPRCGFPAPISRRASIEGVDDISPKNLERLKDKSLKIKNGKGYVVNDLKIKNLLEPMASYKNFDYRNKIANRYGMFLYINEYNTWTPCLKKEFDSSVPKKSLFEAYKERYR